MGLTRASEAKARLYGVLRIALGATMLGAGIWVGIATVASPSVGAATGCLVTAVDVTVHNNTNVPLRLGSAEHGITNAWCSALPGFLAPHLVGQFVGGDDFFGTELAVSYVAPNHDTIGMSAESGYFADAARCRVVPNGSSPSPYTCSVSWRAEVLNRGALFGLGTHVVLVDWTIAGP